MSDGCEARTRAREEIAELLKRLRYDGASWAQPLFNEAAAVIEQLLSLPAGQEWRDDLENATASDCVLLTKFGGIVSGCWNGKTFCWWVHGGGSLYKDQILGWLPRSALPAPPVAESISESCDSQTQGEVR